MILNANSEAAKAYLPLITNKGELRASKPKDGNAAYVWRMVAFSLSTEGRHHCMPVTADFSVVVPEDWEIEPPADWLKKTIGDILAKPDSIRYCVEQKGSVEAYAQDNWKRYGRRKHFIKTVLDPVVTEIVSRVPVQDQPGTKRWAKAFGVI